MAMGCLEYHVAFEVSIESKDHDTIPTIPRGVSLRYLKIHKIQCPCMILFTYICFSF